MKFLFLFIGLLSYTSIFAECYTKISSSSGNITAIVSVENGNVAMSIKSMNNVILEKTQLRILMNDEVVYWNISGVQKELQSRDYYPQIGEYKQISEEYGEGVFDLRGFNDIRGVFYVRVYEETVTYRFKIKGKNDEKFTVAESVDFCLSDKNAEFYAPRGEHGHYGPFRCGSNCPYNVTTPLICDADGYALAIHEAGFCLNYPSMMLCSAKDTSFPSLELSSESVSGEMLLPWRIIMIADSIPNLSMSKKRYYGLNEPAIGDYSWESPGIGLWDWRIVGLSYGWGCYLPNTQSIKRLVDYADKENLQFVLLDALWSRADEGKPLDPVETLDLREIIKYAKSKQIQIWLYYDLAYTEKGVQEIDFKTVAKTFSNYGVAGIKYGFLGIRGPKFSGAKKVNETIDKIRIAAQNKLMISFHDNPIPFSGIERTFPNYVNREYCHSQMDRRWSFTPSYFVKSAYINLLAGPLDQANGIFGIEKSMERLKGPKNNLYTTVASEIARCLITHTGMQLVLPDTPEEYNAKSDLFRFISMFPNRWDESFVIDGKFPQYITMARRVDSRWFIGSVWDEKGGKQELSTDFLEFGVLYTATLYIDTPQSHYIYNREKYDIKTIKIRRGQILNMNIAPGGGFAIVFTPVNNVFE